MTDPQHKPKVVAVIPARMGASRFPGKPLAPILGLPMVEHVRRRALLADGVDDVVVATCDVEIFDAVTRAGGKAVMTKSSHERCTDRVHEAAASIDLDIAVIVQGDEPLFDPRALSLLVEPMLRDPAIPCVNLISVIHDPADLNDVDIVKAVLDEQSYVMCFSRAALPHVRVANGCPLYRQTGVSAFTRAFLDTYSGLAPTPLEVAESVDFLRILGHRHPIKAVIWDDTTIGVDRPGDVAKVEAELLDNPEQNALYQRILAL